MLGRLKILLAIFQESYYDAAVFRSWLARHPQPRDWDSFRDLASLHWTAKSRLLFRLAAVFSFGRATALPRALVSAQAVMAPAERLAIWWLGRRARRHIRRGGTKTIIAITGSFGKTTTKEILARVLSQKFRVHASPENVNTLLGLISWISSRRFEKNDLLIVELGAHRRGDIARLARVIRPNIGILTGINEAHLERFGSLENIKAAKCELFDSLPALEGKGYWNRESKFLGAAVAERSAAWSRRGLTLIPYSGAGTVKFRLEVSRADETILSVQAEKLSGPRQAVAATVRLLGKHHAAAIAVALAVAGELGLNAEEVKRGLESLRPLPRRLAPAYGPSGSLIVDDSYNITLDGVRAAIEAIAPLARRKIGVFAGIPEAGQRAVLLNETLGRLIAPVFHVLLLRHTPVERAVAAGLRQAGWNEANIIRYTTREELDELLADAIKPRDCIYFSAYDWPAIYL